MKVRKELEGISWETIANTQITAIRQLEMEQGSLLNQDMDKKIMEQDILSYAKTMRERYKEESDFPYYVASTGVGAERGGNKLLFVGRKVADFGKEKATRIYTAISLNRLKDGFEKVREQFVADGVLDHILLALNLETLDNADPQIVDNNAIIMYVPDSDPQVLTQLAVSLKKVKAANPNIFQFPTSQLAKVKAEATSQFMVPLDNTSWFVEVEKEKRTRSYHTDIFADMTKYIYWGKKPLVNGMPNIQQYRDFVNVVVPAAREKAKIFDFDGGKFLPRRILMPGLVSAA